MNKSEARERIEKLKLLIDRHRYAYHVLNRLEISEEALDALKHELKKLEDQFPDLVTSDSPTQRVAGRPLSGFKKVTHRVRMLSLEDVFSNEEFSEWFERIKKLQPDEKFSFYVEPKFDGLAISLLYEDGVLTRAATRGDGTVGEDITHNIRTIESVPLRMRPEGKFSKGPVEIRGEAIITKKNFDAINREQKKKGEPTYANSRNLAAGSLRQLDPKITAARKLDFFAYDIVGAFEDDVHSAEHQVLRACGFRTGDAVEKLCKNVAEVASHHRAVEAA